MHLMLFKREDRGWRAPLSERLDFSRVLVTPDDLFRTAVVVSHVEGALARSSIRREICLGLCLIDPDATFTLHVLTSALVVSLGERKSEKDFPHRNLPQTIHEAAHTQPITEDSVFH
jgi:hypothetical protein